MAPKSQDLRLKLLNFGYILGFTPIRWDNSAEVLRISPSRIRLGWIKVQLLLVLIYEMFLIYQATQPGKAENPLGRLEILYLTVMWILMNPEYIGCIWLSDYVELMNKLSEYVKEFKRCKCQMRSVTFPVMILTNFMFQ